MDVGVNPRHQIIGFTNYRPPYGPFRSYLDDRVGMGDTSRFLGAWSVMSDLEPFSCIELSGPCSKCIVCIYGDGASEPLFGSTLDRLTCTTRLASPSGRQSTLVRLFPQVSVFAANSLLVY